MEKVDELICNIIRDTKNCSRFTYGVEVTYLDGFAESRSGLLRKGLTSAILNLTENVPY
jgi:hypothetical protein